jgi:hypothetical protein
LTFGPDTVRFADIRNQDIPWIRGKFTVIFPQKRTGSFKYDDTQLAFDVMGVHGKLLTGTEIEV